MNEVIHEEVFQNMIFKISKIVENSKLPPKYKVSTEDSEMLEPNSEGNTYMLEFKRWTICTKQKEAWSVLASLKREHQLPEVQ